MTERLASFDELLRHQAGLRARLDVHVESFSKTLGDSLARLEQVAARVEDSAARAELKPRPPLNLPALAATLDGRGVQALAPREQRALLQAPSLMTPPRLMALCAENPANSLTAARFALREWRALHAESWGVAYRASLTRSGANLPLPLLALAVVTPAVLWGERKAAEAAILRATSASDLPALHARMKTRLGLRDSWGITAALLMGWLESHNGPLDPHADAVLDHPRLRALLLPAPASGRSSTAPVTDVSFHAHSVAMWLRAGFGTKRRITDVTRAKLVEAFFHSAFGDPRVPSPSEGWVRVRDQDEAAFRAMLSSFARQDLEVFFSHAMREDDRKKFWLRYLPAIERTGCVLNHEMRQRLERNLMAQPELRDAIRRAHVYGKSSSDADAFYLVFKDVVVVEFSVSGNAAYVYPRAYFERKLEPQIVKKDIDRAAELKITSENLERIHHSGNWEYRARDLLARFGVHPGG